MSQLRLCFMQLVLRPMEILNLRLEFSSGLAEFFFRALLRPGNRQDQNAGQRKNRQTWYFFRIQSQRMERSQEVVFERQQGKRHGQHARLESTYPGGEHYRSKKQRNWRRLQIKLQSRYEQRCGDRQKSHAVTQHRPRSCPGQNTTTLTSRSQLRFVVHAA